MLIQDFNKVPKVGALDIDVPEFHQDLLYTINGALSFTAQRDPMLFGGGPRDHLYNAFIKFERSPKITPRDYDVIIRAPDHLYDSTHGKVNAEQATKHALDDLANYAGFKDPEVLEAAYGFESGRIIFEYDGKNIEVVITRPWNSNEDFIEGATDAPINGIGTTLSGQTLIQLECIDHLQNQIYRFDHSVDHIRFLERMRKMREHYPHIRGILSPTNYYGEKKFIEAAPEIAEEGLLILPEDPAYRRFIGAGIHDLEWTSRKPIEVIFQL